ncbi:MAG TPA: ABC transporter permease, partial [Coleofasciculaceae cyanobacterium]
IGLMLLLLFTALATQTIHPTILLLPLVWLPQLLLTAGLGYLASALTVFLRDIPQTLGVILNLWFYITPIIYPASAVPEVLRPLVFWVNPLTVISELYRDLILIGQINHWTEWGVMSLFSLIIFYCGLSIYRRLRPAFADVL